MIGVISFPGSNGDDDAMRAFRDEVGTPTRKINYRETDLRGLDAVVLPGGFSYGDYLRCGAIARFAPVIDAVQNFAGRGGPVLGICNGFQILTEAGLLPGALLRNNTLRFHCFWARVRLEETASDWIEERDWGRVVDLPVAHGEGAYYADSALLERLEGNGQVVARYCDELGNISHKTNPNKSTNAIAGVRNQAGNIVGLMPHPERASNRLIGGDDGLVLLRTAARMVTAV